MAQFPGAKVILTHRPAEDWWASFSKTIRVALSSGADVGGLGSRVITQGVFGGNIDDKDHVIAVYEASIAAVRREVPADRLIDLPLGAGWGPLCAGFGLPVPEADYPRGNATESFRAQA